MITWKMKILQTEVSKALNGVNFNCVDNEVDDLMGDEEWDVENAGGDESDNRFDQTVGCLQEILMDQEFEGMQQKFC